ncbi:MAG: hypothetical protein ACYDGY_09085 [Acidimicrobiales bacterium]
MTLVPLFKRSVGYDTSAQAQPCPSVNRIRANARGDGDLALMYDGSGADGLGSVAHRRTRFHGR